MDELHGVLGVGSLLLIGGGIWRVSDFGWSMVVIGGLILCGVILGRRNVPKPD